jgi:hypothetical protein
MQLHSQANPIRSLDFLIVPFNTLLVMNKISENRLRKQRGKPDKRQ